MRRHIPGEKFCHGIDRIDHQVGLVNDQWIDLA